MRPLLLGSVAARAHAWGVRSADPQQRGACDRTADRGPSEPSPSWSAAAADRRGDHPSAPGPVRAGGPLAPAGSAAQSRVAATLGRPGRRSRATGSRLACGRCAGWGRGRRATSCCTATGASIEAWREISRWCGWPRACSAARADTGDTERLFEPYGEWRGIGLAVADASSAGRPARAAGVNVDLACPLRVEGETRHAAGVTSRRTR